MAARTLAPIYVDPIRLESAVLNLCINSRDAMPEGGTITIETMDKVLDANYVADHLDVQPGRYVLIAVTDSGSGGGQRVVHRVPVGRGPAGLGGGQQGAGSFPYLLADAPGRPPRHGSHLTNYG